MSAVITIGELKEQGRIQKGDTLHHSETGAHTVAYVKPNKSICVRDTAGRYFTWHLNLPADTRVN